MSPKEKFWKIYFSALLLFKCYQKTSGCGSDTCIFSANLKSYQLVTGVLYHTKLGTTKKNKDVIFSCQKIFSAATLWNYSKMANTAKVYKIDTLPPIRQLTSILFCNLIWHIYRIILHNIAFLISFVRKSIARLIVFLKRLQDIFKRFYSKLIL